MPSKYAIFIMTAALAGALAGCESPPRDTAPARPADTTSAGSVDYRQREIERRIEDAFRSGRITAEDQRQLKAQADDIRREERRFMADGDLSQTERNTLNGRLDTLSRELERRSEQRR